MSFDNKICSEYLDKFHFYFTLKMAFLFLLTMWFLIYYFFIFSSVGGIVDSEVNLAV